MPRVCEIRISGPACRNSVPFEAVAPGKGPGTASAAFHNKRQRQTRLPLHPRGNRIPTFGSQPLGHGKLFRRWDGVRGTPRGSTEGPSRDAPPGVQRGGPPSPFLPWAARGGAERGRRSPSLPAGAQRSPATARSRAGNFARLRSRRGALRGLRGDKGRGLAQGAGPGLRGGDAARRGAEPGARSSAGSRAGARRGARSGERGTERRRARPGCGGAAGGGSRAGQHPAPGGVAGRGSGASRPRGTEGGGPGAEPPRSPGAGARRRRPHGRRRGRLCAGLARRG